MKVLIAGSLTWDRNIFNGNERQGIGGAVLHSAKAYQLSGNDVEVAFRAPPQLADELLQSLDDVVLHHQLSDSITRFTNRDLGKGQRQQTIDGFAPGITLIADRDIDILHLSPLHHLDLDTKWYDAKTDIALDLQGLVRTTKLGSVVPECTSEIDHCLRKVRWLKASEMELLCLLEKVQLDEAGFSRANPQMEVIVTRAENGGWIRYSGDVITSWNSTPIESDVDTTGAGDVFFAFYLSARCQLNQHDAAHYAARSTSELLRSRVK
jgi:hypothetical protein